MIAEALRYGGASAMLPYSATPGILHAKKPT